MDCTVGLEKSSRGNSRSLKSRRATQGRDGNKKGAHLEKLLEELQRGIHNVVVRGIHGVVNAQLQDLHQNNKDN